MCIASGSGKTYSAIQLRMEEEPLKETTMSLFVSSVDRKPCISVILPLEQWSLVQPGETLRGRTWKPWGYGNTPEGREDFGARRRDLGTCILATGHNGVHIRLAVTVRGGSVLGVEVKLPDLVIGDFDIFHGDRQVSMAKPLNH